MKLYDSSEEAGIPRGMVLGIGNFDGVHRGHQAVIGEVLTRAGQSGVPAGLLTFEPHPLAVLSGGAPPPRLYTAQEKEALLASTGIAVLIRQPFTRDFAALSPEAFAREVLARRLAPRGVVTGHDFRFGAGGGGDVAFLEQAGRELGFAATWVGEVLVGDRPVRSSTIRELIAAGRMAETARLLGRPWHLSGEVIPGAGVGRGLGFPTANLLPPDKLCPPDGVYAGEAVLDGSPRPAAVNIGAPGNRGGHLIEAYLLDFDGDLYGRTQEVRFRERIRAERSFPDQAALAARIREDVSRVRELAAGGRW